VDLSAIGSRVGGHASEGRQGRVECHLHPTARFAGGAAKIAIPDDDCRPADLSCSVVLDPTTYAPTVISYEGHHLDWTSSQVFFQHGFLEHSAEFTLSGRADDRPISYATGNRRIAATAFASLGVSLINNLTSAIIERALIERYPKHRKLTRTLGWVERISFASFLAYGESAAHFRRMRTGSGAYGFDAGRGIYVDLIEAGIIDPTKVVRVAIENAVSVAGVLLLTEATLTEVPEPKHEAREPAAVE
jgi:hypothetical protein